VKGFTNLIAAVTWERYTEGYFVHTVQTAYWFH
jgi:hypothetical protein